ncbi:MAG: metalloprotease [Sediminibacterium sp.]|nr:metalloprotease [Sediminibacterium sp.]
MRWLGNKESDNVDDRRGGGGKGLAMGGGIGTIIIALIYLFMGGDPSQVANQLQNAIPSQQNNTSVPRSAEEEKLASFTKVVLGLTESVWDSIYQSKGSQYEKPVLVMFTDQTQSGCGAASAASGPFYCPGDKRVYIDLSFFDELAQKFQAPGEFAMAYVIAHEVGHHLQTLNGTSQKVHSARSRVSEKEYNQLSVKLELQADFLAGVWAHHANKLKNILDPGDLEAALNAANAIGDDRLQKQSKGYVVPDAFTHGTSKQRMYWFKKGFDSGDLSQGNTFAGIEE